MFASDTSRQKRKTSLCPPRTDLTAWLTLAPPQHLLPPPHDSQENILGAPWGPAGMVAVPTAGDHGSAHGNCCPKRKGGARHG